MSAALYLRVSTQEQQLEGVSPEAQEARGRAYCSLNKLGDPLVFYDGGVSGSVPLAERPQGGLMLDAIRRGEVRHVVSLKLDRLFRDALDALRVSQDWEKAGVAMHLIDMGGQTLNTSTAMGKLFLTITAAIAECERNLTRERTKTALQHKRERGDRLGAPALGMTKDGNATPDEIETVRVILKLRRRDPQRWSFREIAARLSAEGHKTKRGGEWAPQTVKRVWDRRASYATIL